MLKRILICSIALVVWLCGMSLSCLAQAPEDIHEKISIGQKDGLKLTAEVYKQEYKAADEMLVTLSSRI